MRKPNFVAALRQADQLLVNAGMPKDVDRRLRERLGLIRSKRPSVRRVWVRALGVGVVLAGAAGAAVLIATSGYFGDRSTAPARLEDFSVREPSSNFRAVVALDRSVEVQSGTGTLVDEKEGMSLEVVGPSVIRRESLGLRLARGTFRVAVDKRAPGTRAARLLVSHGAIEVLGTRFTVIQREDGGSVSLSEGAIRFVGSDDRTVLLAPGDVLDWPFPAHPRAGALKGRSHKSKVLAAHHPRRTQKIRGQELRDQETQDQETQEQEFQEEELVEPEIAAVDEPQQTVDVEGVLQRIATLRSRGRYQQAVRELERMLGDPLEPVTRERLSFELGSMLVHNLQDDKRACAHFRAHTREYPHGRYQPEIRAMERQLRCREERR